MSGQDDGVNSRQNHRLCCMTSKKKSITRTRSQGVNNDNVKVPLTKGTRVDPT